jgi:hypothetical protein
MLSSRRGGEPVSGGVTALRGEHRRCLATGTILILGGNT